MAQYVVWDWNGTLLDDVDACVCSLNDILSPRDLPRVSVADYRSRFCFPVKNYYEELGFDFGIEDWHALALEYHKAYEIYAEKSVLRYGVSVTLKQLRDSGVGMSLLSACESGILRNMLAQRDIESYFMGIYGLNNLYAESKIEIGRCMFKELRIPLDEALIVGDTDHDFEVAKQLGCSCLLVAGGHQSVARLEKCDCPVVSGFSEVVEFVMQRSEQ